MHSTAQLHIGTSGWIYADWRGRFYPEQLPQKRWLEFYATRFTTVELNVTFYRLPPEATFAGWARRVPEGFLYAVKASRTITHLRRLEAVEEPLQLLLARARCLGPHLGPILYQLPPRWGRDIPRLRAFLALLPADLRHVFEFRDPSWYHPEVRDLLAEAGMNFCIHDLRGFECPPWVTGTLVYLRFHGPGKTPYTGRYSRAHLRAWAERIRAWREAGRDVFAYFNNDIGGHAVVNALELRELAGEAAMAASNGGPAASNG